MPGRIETHKEHLGFHDGAWVRPEAAGWADAGFPGPERSRACRAPDDVNLATGPDAPVAPGARIGY
jgi:hypothetical protein